MTVVYVLLALIASACFYAATAHQHLLPQLHRYKVALRACGTVFFVAATIVAARQLGFWAAFFAALTTLMLGCVVLPYCHAWRIHREHRHVE